MDLHLFDSKEYIFICLKVLKLGIFRLFGIYSGERSSPFNITILELWFRFKIFFIF